jgi:hypothetical protein
VTLAQGHERDQSVPKRLQKDKIKEIYQKKRIKILPKSINKYNNSKKSHKGKLLSRKLIGLLPEKMWLRLKRT